MQRTGRTLGVEAKEFFAKYRATSIYRGLVRSA